MGAVYLVTGSLVACMVIHALMDLHSGQVARAAFLRVEAPGPAAEPPAPVTEPIPPPEPPAPA
jgi:hypothetical protein